MNWQEVAVYLVALWLARGLYRDAKRAVLAFPTRLRFRRPVDCGEGLPSATGLVECARTKLPANRSDARVAREREEIRQRRMEMANRLPSPREQEGLANARDFQRSHWEAQSAPPRPTALANAIRYAQEGGTW